MTTEPVAVSTTKSADQAIIRQLKATGFSDECVLPPRRLICAVEGHELTGKTHFALTAPEPIVLFNVDLGLEGVVHKFQGAGKQVLVFDVRVPKEPSKTAPYPALWAETKARIKKAYALSQGTVVWDTESEINELARLAHFGKLSQVLPHNYQEVNRELRDVLDWAYDSKMSSIFIRKLKPKWVNNARTNEYEAAGWGDMEYKCQLYLSTQRMAGDGGPEFSAVVEKCRHNPNLVGQVLRGPMCNFEFLLSLVHDK